MSWNDDHYDKDEDGNFINNEAERALEDGNLKKSNMGTFLWDPDTGEEYWLDGTKR